MSAKLIRINPENPEKHLIELAVSVVRSGGIIVYPTETVYGLGADLYNREAVARLYTVKGRDPTKPVSLLIPNIDTLNNIVACVSPSAKILIERFWPGPLTLIFKARSDFLLPILDPGLTIALRVSSHAIARALTEELGAPLISSSANLSGHTPARSAQEALENMGSNVELVIDGGLSKSDVPSTVVDVSGDKVVVVRPGKIAPEAIREVVLSYMI